MSWTSRDKGLLGVAIALGPIACSPTEPTTADSRPIGAVTQEVKNGDSRNVTSSTVFPEGAVGYIYSNSGPNSCSFCSATVIQRNTLLTAAHCMCQPATTTEFSFTPSPPIPPGQSCPNPGFGIPVTSLTSLDVNNFCGHVAADDLDDEDSATDLAVGILSRNLTPTEVSGVMPVLLDENDVLLHIDGVGDIPGGGLNPPLEAIGWGGGFPPSIRTKGSINDFEIGIDCGILGLGSCGGRWIQAPHGDQAETQKGDSGGPLTFRMLGDNAEIFGVASTTESFDAFGQIFFSDQSIWAPTYLNGNGPRIAPFLDDPDGDGVNELVDNCPAAKCLPFRSAGACNNPGQEDVDRDGIGDVCDNCPAVPNQSQKDFDKDRSGDACDTCPLNRAYPPGSDGDTGDGVGFACDNCPDNPNPYPTCFRDADCPSSFCALADTGVGHCAAQEDDPDHDRIGAPCDLCPNVSDRDVQLNSNERAEQRAGVIARGDACDVPLFVNTPILRTPDDPAGLSTLLSPSDATLFASYAGVGGRPPGGTFTGPTVGFRHCSCHDPNSDTDIPEDNCLGLTCSTDFNEFVDGNSSWKPVTTGVNPDTTTTSVPPATLDLTISPKYTSDIHCGGPLGDYICRVGTPELLVWYQAQDIAAGRVQAFDHGIRTTGFLWSHGSAGPGIVTSDERDGATQGHLRDQYRFVRTPFFSVELGIGTIIDRFRPGVDCKHDPQCAVYLPIDRLRPWINPVNDVGGILSIIASSRPGILFPDGNRIGFLTRPAGLANRFVDVASVFSATASARLFDASSSWLPPQEATSRAISGPGKTISVVLPRSWTPDATVNRIVATTTGFDAVPLGPSGGGRVPFARSGARALYSSTEDSMYLVGGNVGPQPTGEVWRLSLAANRWEQLFATADSNNHQVRVASPLALALDAPRSKLVVLDDATASPPATLHAQRLVVFDTRVQTSKVVTAPNLTAFSKVALAVDVQGSFVLLGTNWDAASWKAYRFRLTATDDVVWTGTTQGSGQVLTDPYSSDSGMLFAAQFGDDTRMVELSPAAFIGQGPPADLSICDRPTIVAPPNVVVTRCQAPNLGSPVVKGGCIATRVSNDAPSTLPLGETVVRWRVEDGLGRRVEATQRVIAQLGDDVTCCPSGAHVIVGTPLADVLIGTAGPDCIIGGGGPDAISGGDGDDFLSGGDGTDAIVGGNGNDSVYGGNDPDTLWGGPGDDTLSGGGGPDSLFGEAGRDSLLGDDGNDHLEGGLDDDTMTGGAGVDSCIQGPGHGTSACEISL